MIVCAGHLRRQHQDHHSAVTPFLCRNENGRFDFLIARRDRLGQVEADVYAVTRCDQHRGGERHCYSSHLCLSRNEGRIWCANTDWSAAWTQPNWTNHKVVVAYVVAYFELQSDRVVRL